MTRKKTKHKLLHPVSLILVLLMSDSCLAAEESNDNKPSARNAKEAALASKTPGTTELEAMTVLGNVGNDPYNQSYNVTNSSTATKTDTPIMETPMSIEIVPQAVIQDQQAYRVQDAVKNVSGVQQRSSGGGFDRFIVRGFDVGELYYRNGIRIPRINSDFANVQQIEVLKGPASGLFGRIEPGGLINVVTKRPDTEAHYALEQRFGSYDYYRTQFNATGPVTSDEQLTYRFDLSYLNSDSFRESSFNDRIFVAPSLTWKPREDTEFNLTVEYLNEDRVYDSGLPAIGDRIANVPISRQFDQPGLNDNHEYWLVDFNWSHNFNDNWKIRNGVVALEYYQDNQETYTNAVLADNRTIERWTWFGDPDNNKISAQTVFMDVNGKFETFGIKHNVLVGGDYYYAKSYDSATAQPLDTIDLYNPVFPVLDIDALASAPRGFNYVESNEWYGVYFQDQMTFWDTLHIMGGGRYDIATNGNGYSGSSLAEAKAAFDDIEQNKFSPRVGIVYQPWQWFSVYGNFVESFGPSNGRSNNGQPFKPQTATQFEAGIKTEFMGGLLTGNLAFFHLTKENTLTTDPNNPLLRVAIGEARSQGIELDVAGQVTEGLSMIGTYAWTDARITQDNSGNEGKRLPFVPLHSGSIWLKYDFTQAWMNGFSLGAGVYAASKRFGDAANSFSDGAYARVDLLAAYRFEAGPTRITTQLNINNVTDTEYFLMRSRVNNQPAEPLTVMGSVRVEY
jgi:iron complex outermembrane receptor protein